MEYQYEYFMSDALALPKDAWKPFHNAGPVLSYPKNKLLYNQGDTAFCFYYIVSGRIKTFISSAEGNERLLTIYRRGDILGEAAFFDERPRVSSAQMMADTKVVSIDRPALERCMQQFPCRDIYPPGSVCFRLIWTPLLFCLQRNGSSDCCSTWTAAATILLPAPMKSWPMPWV